MNFCLTKIGIIGYGAPASYNGVKLFEYSNHFEYVLEDSEIKHNKFIPETNAN